MAPPPHATPAGVCRHAPCTMPQYSPPVLCFPQRSACCARRPVGYSGGGRRLLGAVTCGAPTGRRRHGITQSTSETHTAGGGAPGGTPHVSRACRRAWCGRPRWDRRSRGTMDTLWHEVWTGIYTDFSDLPGVREFTQLLLRLGLAASLGSLLGFQREIVGRAAGLRTHMLVA